MRAGMLCDALAERGHEVRWFGSTFDHYQKRLRPERPGAYTTKSGVILELVQGTGYPTNSSPLRLGHNALVAYRMWKKAKELMDDSASKPDVIVADLPMPATAFAASSLTQSHQIPFVVCIRDLWPDYFANFLAPPKAAISAPIIYLMDMIVRKACSRADSLVGISSGYLGWGLAKAKRNLRPSDGVFPLGYAPEQGVSDPAAAVSLKEKGISLTKPIAVFVGSWGNTYDLGTLLDVAELSVDRAPLQIVIAGGGDQENMVRARASELSNVILPGWLSKTEIATLLAHATIGLSPYPPNAPQGLPNKLFEYMSAGLYQISTLGPEAASVLSEGNAGLTVQAGDPVAFAQALHQTCGKPSLAESRQAIKDYFNQNFHADTIYPAYVDFLEELVKENSLR